MAKRSIEIEREYRQYTKMSPEFVHLTGESLKQQIGGLYNKVEKVSAKIENLSAEIEELKKSDKEEDKKALEAKSAQKESLSKVLEAAKKERDEQKPKLEKQLNRVQGFEKNKEQIARIKQIKSDLRSKKLHLEWEIRQNEKLISELEDKLNEIDEDVNTKLVISELEKMEKTDVKEFYAEDFTRLDELRDEKAKIDKEKAGINSQITSLKNTNKDLGHRIDTLNTEIAKCDFAWKNLFANKTWDEIEAKSMDGRFTKKEDKAKQEEPAKEEKEDVIDIEAKPEITFEDFGKLQFQVGKIIKCEEVKKSKKLLCSQVQIGSQVRQIVSGIKAHYSAEEMVGKRVMVVTNLKPAKLAGVLSEGMILCAEDADGNLSLMVPEKEMPAGAEIC